MAKSPQVYLYIYLLFTTEYSVLLLKLNCPAKSFICCIAFDLSSHVRSVPTNSTQMALVSSSSSLLPTPYLQDFTKTLGDSEPRGLPPEWILYKDERSIFGARTLEI